MITRSTAGRFHRLDRRFESVVAHTLRQIIVWHTDEKEPRVDSDDVVHRFHMFLQISQHMLRVGPLPLVVFLHSRDQRSRASCSFVVAASLGTSLDSAVVSPSLSPSLPWLVHLRLGSLSWPYAFCPVQHSERVSAVAGFSAQVDVAKLRPSVVTRFHACSKVWVLLSRVQERELVAHHVEVNPLPAQLRAFGRGGLRSLGSSMRVDGEPFASHNLREDLVLGDVSICFLPALLLEVAFLCRDTLLFGQVLAERRFRARPFRGLEHVLLCWRHLPHHGSVLLRAALCFSAHSSLSSARSSLCDSALCVVLVDRVFPLVDHVGKLMRIVCESILVRCLAT